MLEKTSPSRRGLRFLKRVMYSQMAMRDAVLILLGKQRPNLSFKVLAEPCSIYINFTIKPAMASEFSRYINLADGLVPVPIRCLAGGSHRVDRVNRISSLRPSHRGVPCGGNLQRLSRAGQDLHDDWAGTLDQRRARRVS